MRRILPRELCGINLDLHHLEVLPESWTKRHGFSLYRDTPRPHSALFLICTDICATFTPREGEAVTARQGDVVWIPHGVCYFVTIQGGNEHRIDTYTLNFDLFDEGGEEILLSDSITVLTSRQDGLPETHAKAICQAMSVDSERAHGPSGNRLQIKSEFYALLNTVTAQSHGAADAYYPIRVGAEALRNEWDQNKRIESYAALCGVSPAYFYRCFRHFSGQSPVEYRNGIRLFHAKTMLRHTDMKISEISETVGFEDPFYFCRLFAKTFGISPRAYRNQRSPDGEPV